MGGSARKWARPASRCGVVTAVETERFGALYLSTVTG